MKIPSLLAFFATTVLTAQAAWSHHSTAGYDPNKVQTVTGTVTKFHWTNPHIFIYLSVPDNKGGTVEWAVEGGTPNINIRHGWKSDDIKAGDKITVLVHPARNGSPDGQADTITLANGEIRYAPGHDARGGPGGPPGGAGPGGPGAPPPQ